MSNHLSIRRTSSACIVINALRAVLCLAALGGASSALADDSNLYLAQAKVFYQGLEFEKCLQRLDQATRLPETSRVEMAQIQLYSGLCRYNLGKRSEAEGNFRIALELDPEVTLPPETSPRIAEVFDPLAKQARKNRPAPQQQIAAGTSTNAGAGAASSASPGSAAAKTSDAPRTVTLAPSPAGRTSGELTATAPKSGSKVLPIALGATSVAATGLAAVFGVMAKNHEAQANDPATFYGDAQTLGASARGEATAANVCIGVAVAAATGAVVTWITSE